MSIAAMTTSGCHVGKDGSPLRTEQGGLEGAIGQEAESERERAVFVSSVVWGIARKPVPVPVDCAWVFGVSRIGISTLSTEERGERREEKEEKGSGDEYEYGWWFTGERFEAKDQCAKRMAHMQTHALYTRPGR